MMQARAAGGHARARPASCAGRHGMPLTLRARPGPSRTSPCTDSVRAPTRSRPYVLAPEGEGEAAGRLECRWQRDQLPEAIRELVLDDQRFRNRRLLVSVRLLSARRAASTAHKPIERTPRADSSDSTIETGTPVQ